jgi:PIN domain nuclease of toxin-antitoxin system
MLLDTHVLVWLLEGDERLAKDVVAHIEQAAQENALLVAAITPWEIAMLVAKGRLTLARDVQEWIDEALAQPGISLVPLDPAISVACTRLPGALHGDPADRMLAATARHWEAILITADEQLLTYGRAGHLKVMDARRGA